MKTFTTPLTKFLTLLAIILVALSVNYLYAAWTAPTAAPTGGNIDAPINTGANTQLKTGGTIFSTNLLADDLQVLSDAVPDVGTMIADFNGDVGAARYCDETGANCFDAATVATNVTNLPTCADGQVLKSQGGAWVCGTDNTGSGGGGCAMHYTTRSPGCEVQNWSSCPSGYTQYNQQSVYCANGDPGGGNRNVTYCQRQYCASDTDTDLVNGVHNAYDCLDEGGELVSNFSLCRFNNTSSCPSGWTDDGSSNNWAWPRVTCY